jgi:hypothetical protein
MNYLDLYNKYIKDTEYRARIPFHKTLVCYSKVNGHSIPVTISTWSLKHMYDRHIFDKETHLIFNTLLKNIPLIITKPDEIRNNDSTKRGNLLFIRKIRKQKYYLSVEILSQDSMEIVSGTRTRPSYLRKFPLA